MNLSTITIGELSDYAASESYKRTNVIPITIQRAVSQVNNPRASKDDPALIVAEDEVGQVIGFIGMLSDLIFNPEKKKVFWISCWWTDPVKGKMLGVPLLLAAYQATEGKLIADSIPETLPVFKKSKLFVVPEPKPGIKLFLQPLVADLLLRKKPSLKPYKFALQMADLCISALFAPINFSRSFVNKIPEGVVVKYSNSESDPKFDTLFKRNKPDFDWIINYPWVISENQYKEKRYYPFSSTAKRFEHFQVSIEKDGKTALLHITVRDGVAKLHYTSIQTDLAEIVPKVLLKFLNKIRAKEFISFDTGINNQLRKKAIPFCVKHLTSYQYVWGKPLSELNTGLFQYGDGDAIFT